MNRESGFVHIVVLAGLALAVVGAGWWINTRSQTAQNTSQPSTPGILQQTQDSLSSTGNQDSNENLSEAFQELTIPYLRQKTYDSQLAELMKVGETSSYTSYVTSFTSDGLKVNGLLTQPKGTIPEGGWPAIIFIHGYLAPTTYETQGQPYRSYVDYLAKSGFVVFKIDLRGHGESEGEPGGAYYSADYSIDALNAYSALQKADFVKDSQIGIWGHSMAGNVTARAIAIKPDIPAVVIWGGAVYSYEDFVKYGISDNSYRPPQLATERQRRRQELFNTHGQFNKDSQFWKVVAPTNYVSDIKTAIQLHHAANDEVVNVGYSRDLNTLLDQTAIVHEYYEYPSGGHDIEGASFTSAMQRTVEFFSKHLNS